MVDLLSVSRFAIVFRMFVRGTSMGVGLAANAPESGGRAEDGEEEGLEAGF